jgi:hypothetical protein
MRSLHWIDGAADVPMLVTPNDVPSPVSANLCEEPLDMLPEDERASLSVDVAWEAQARSPDDVDGLRMLLLVARLASWHHPFCARFLMGFTLIVS